MSNRFPVVVLGASSQIGVFLLPLLCRAGASVIALSRDAPPAWASGLVGVQWTRLEQCREFIGDRPWQLISAGPLSAAVQLVRQQPNLDRVVAFSTASLLFKSESPDPGERRLMATISKAENDFQALARSSQFPLLIFRPTMIFGAGLDQTVTRLANWVRRWGWLPLALNARGLRQPVFAGDLAELSLLALSRSEPVNGVFSVGGGSIVSYQQMVSEVFKALGKPERIIRLPAFMLATMAVVAGWFSALAPSAEVIHRQSMDLHVDNGPLQQVFGFKPRPFQLEARHLVSPQQPR